MTPPFLTRIFGSMVLALVAAAGLLHGGLYNKVVQIGMAAPNFQNLPGIDGQKGGRGRCVRRRSEIHRQESVSRCSAFILGVSRTREQSKATGIRPL